MKNQTGISITQLQKVNEIFEEMEALNAEKLVLEQLAEYLATHGGDVHVGMHMAEDYAKPRDNYPASMSSMGTDFDFIARLTGMPARASRMQYPNMPQHEPPQAREPVITIHEEMPDTLALQIIGLLIGHKNAQIRAMVDELVEMGFKR
jgi:hypothetical protein